MRAILNKILVLRVHLTTAAMILLVSHTSMARDYHVSSFGAIANDTARLASDGINAAIKACAHDGGGRVVVDAGKYRCGTIFLEDNVELHLSNGAYIYATDGYEDFPMQPQQPYRSQKDKGGWNALIFAASKHNIAVTGGGTIDGRGKGRKGYLKNVPGDGNGRPKNLLFISCSNVRVEGITMLNSSMWNQHYLDCEDVAVTDINVYNHCNGNNDGIDIDGCRRFLLSNSVFDSDDDAIVLKSTGTAPCEDVIIRGCIASSWANAIKLGTESTGGYRNILVADCIVKPSRHRGPRVVKSTSSGISAISIECVDGGTTENISFDNITIHGTECPIYVRLGNRARKHVDDAPQPPVGTMRNISLSNIRAYDAGNFCSSITGIAGHPVENVTLDNIVIENRGGLVRGNFRIKGDDNGKRHDTSGNIFADKYWPSWKQVKEDDHGYPQPTVWGNLPSQGLFIRHASNIRLNNVEFRSKGEEPRPAVIAVDTDGLYTNNVSPKKIQHVK